MTSLYQLKDAKNLLDKARKKFEKGGRENYIDYNNLTIAVECIEKEIKRVEQAEQAENLLTLYDFLNVTQKGFDTYDAKYDMCVTVSYVGKNEHDEYDKFCNAIMKKVNVIKQVSENSLMVNWSDLIGKNLDKFKSFAKEHWIVQYEADMEEFVCQWIKEINLYMAGYVSMDFYDTLNEFVNTLE